MISEEKQSSKTGRINVSMSQEFINKLDEVCLFKNLSRSEWVRRKIDEDHEEIKNLIER